MEEEKISGVKNCLEWIFCIIIAVVIAILFRYYIGTPTVVRMSSMYPTLQNGQRLWLNRWIRNTKSVPERGDIITFEAPSKSELTAEDTEESFLAKYENSPTTLFSKFTYYVLELNKDSYIKRVIGLPNEHVEIKDGKVYIDDKELEEDYLQSGVVTDNVHGGYCVDLVVPEDSVFVLGDNRTGSTDSRKFGCVPIDKIESKVWIRIWPLKLFGKVDK